jgi:hypothetical protein
MYSKSRSNEIIKSFRTTLFFLIFFLLVPLSSCQSQGKNKLDVAKNPSTSSNNQNAAKNHTSTTQRFVGKWRWEVVSRVGPTQLLNQFTFSLDGTFQDSMWASGAQYESGRYQISARTLKLLYKNGKVEQYLFEFSNLSRYDGKNRDLLNLTKPGDDPILKSRLYEKVE